MSIIVRSETCVNDICGNVSASIAVNGQEYSPNQPGHNVVVFDALSGTEWTVVHKMRLNELNHQIHCVHIF